MSSVVLVLDFPVLHKEKFVLWVQIVTKRRKNNSVAFNAETETKTKHAHMFLIWHERENIDLVFPFHLSYFCTSEDGFWHEKWWDLLHPWAEEQV